MLVFKTVQQAVRRLAFSADGSRVAAAGESRKVHVWNLTAKKHKRTVIPELAYWVSFLGFRPDGKLLAVGRFGQALLHDPETGANESFAPDVEGWVGDVVAAPDFSALYGTGWQAIKWTFDGGLRRVWVQPVPKYRSAPVGCGAILTPRGEYLTTLSGGVDRTWLHVRDTGTGELRAEHDLGAGSIIALTLLPDGRVAFARFDRSEHFAGRPGAALVAGAPGGPFEVVRTAAEAGQFTALAPHPSGRWLAVGQTDGLVRVFDTHSWGEVTAYRWTEERVHGVAFAPDGLKAAAGFGNEGKFVVWDVDL